MECMCLPGGFGIGPFSELELGVSGTKGHCTGMNSAEHEAHV